ncbi:MAG: hypothetical protein H0Z28_11975 [Archaeoglobus sp.]|nr:hypothetical protein [Archaeoglobus sp.]
MKNELKLQFSKNLLKQVELLVENNLKIYGGPMTYITAGVSILDSLHFLDENEIKRAISSPNVLWTSCKIKVNKILSVVQPKLLVEFDLYPGILEPLESDRVLYREKIEIYQMLLPETRIFMGIHSVRQSVGERRV